MHFGLSATVRIPFARAGCVAIAFACVACGSGSDTTGPSATDNPYGLTETGPGVLSVSPLDTSTLMAATPLGALAPPGHVLPTDHVYLYFVDAWNGQQQLNDCRARPVRAAGSGVITFTLISQQGGDTKVDIQMTKTFHYYYDHVQLQAGMIVGKHVSAGDTIAYTMGRCPSLDLGVIDADVTPAGFLNSSRYGPTTGHAVSPYKYFAEPLRSWLYARVRVQQGVPANKDGRIDFGIAGKLVGDWFHESLSNASTTNAMGPDGWPKTISFAYDWFDGAVRISIGGTIANPGVLGIGSGDPDPATVSVSDGLIAYKTTATLGSITNGWMLVQMLSAERIRVQYFAGATTQPGGFTAAAQEYVR